MAFNQNQVQAEVQGILQGHEYFADNVDIDDVMQAVDRRIFLTFSRYEHHRGPVTRAMLEEEFAVMFGANVVDHVWLPNVEYPVYGHLILTNAQLVDEVLEAHHPPRRLTVGPREHSVWLKPYQHQQH